MATLGPFTHILVPAGKAGKIYFAEDTTPYFETADFARPDIGATSGATVFRDGVLVELAENEPDWSEPIGGGCPKLLMRPQARNLFLNSETLLTQNVIVTAQAYTVSFRGTGTITFSGAHTGSLIGTGSTQNDYVSATFTPSAGTIICTVSGSVLNANFIEGSNTTGWIPSLGTPLTRSSNSFAFSDLVTKGIIQSTEGTLIFKYFTGTEDRESSNPNLLLGDFNNGIALANSTVAGDVAIRVYANGNQSNTTISGGELKIAFSYGSDGWFVMVNNEASAKDSGPEAITLTLLELVVQGGPKAISIFNLSLSPISLTEAEAIAALNEL